MKCLLDKLKNTDISKKVYTIGIDGLGGAGKSTLVDSLKSELKEKNYNPYVLHIDNFIHPKSIRYNDSKEEWYCYYNLQ